jgi:hypothetical protein
VGFVDDYRKWLKKHPAGGLSANVKMAAQVVLGLGCWDLFLFRPAQRDFRLESFCPVFKGHAHFYLGGFSVALALMVVVGSSNAVNLTDGLDGLAPGTLVVSALAFGVFSYLAGNAKLADYLRLVYVPGAGELTVFLAAMGGACLGFLWFNAHPAEIFMGDTGSSASRRRSRRRGPQRETGTYFAGRRGDLCGRGAFGHASDRVGPVAQRAPDLSYGALCTIISKWADWPRRKSLSGFGLWRSFWRSWP